MVPKPIAFHNGTSRTNWVVSRKDSESSQPFAEMGITRDVVTSWPSSKFNVVLSLHATWMGSYFGIDKWKIDEWHVWCSAVIQCRAPEAKAAYGKVVLIWDPDGFERNEKGRAKLLGAMTRFYTDMRRNSRN